MEEEPDGLLLEDNYYQLLNVGREASAEEITGAYRRCSRMFHPDKHGGDAARQKTAEQSFNRIKQAYEVLSDPHRRAIYDTLGKHGLELEGWEMIVRTRTPREIREEYERLTREREERRLQQSTNPRGTITLSLNATDLFTKYRDEYEILDDPSLVPSVEVSGMSIQQSLDAPLTSRDTLTMSGNISTQNGIGTGSVNLANRRLTSEKGWAELEVGVGNGPSLGLKAFRTLSRLVFASGGAVLQFTPRGIQPSLVSTVALQLDALSVGYLTHRAGGGAGSSLATTYVRDCERHHASAALQLGNPHSFLSVSFVRKMPHAEMKLRFSLKLGTFGAVAEYGAEKKVSQHSSVSAAVALGVPTGVMLKLKWTRASQTIVVPIHLCEELIPAPVFYATVAPLVAWLLLKKLFIERAAEERAASERRRAREANRDRVQELQREALATVELMRETYARIRTDEERRKGLVILSAVYGKLPAGAAGHEAGAPGDRAPHAERYDATVPVQCLVRDSRLQLLAASKAELVGFYDPCVGEPKHLTVRYAFREQPHECTVEDAEALVLPRPAHRLAGA